MSEVDSPWFMYPSRMEGKEGEYNTNGRFVVMSFLKLGKMSDCGWEGLSSAHELQVKENMCVLRCSVMSNSVTPRTVAHQSPLSMGILQARILEWIAMPSSRGSSQPRNRVGVSCIAGGFFNHLEPPGEHTKGEHTKERVDILKGQSLRAARPEISGLQPVLPWQWMRSWGGAGDAMNREMLKEDKGGNPGKTPLLKVRLSSAVCWSGGYIVDSD